MPQHTAWEGGGRCHPRALVLCDDRVDSASVVAVGQLQHLLKLHSGGRPAERGQVDQLAAHTNALTSQPPLQRAAGSSGRELWQYALAGRWLGHTAGARPPDFAGEVCTGLLACDFGIQFDCVHPDHPAVRRHRKRDIQRIVQRQPCTEPSCVSRPHQRSRAVVAAASLFRSKHVWCRALCCVDGPPSTSVPVQGTKAGLTASMS